MGNRKSWTHLVYPLALFSLGIGMAPAGQAQNFPLSTTLVMGVMDNGEQPSKIALENFQSSLQEQPKRTVNTAHDGSVECYMVPYTIPGVQQTMLPGSMLLMPTDVSLASTDTGLHQVYVLRHEGARATSLLWDTLTEQNGQPLEVRYQISSVNAKGHVITSSAIVILNPHGLESQFRDNHVDVVRVPAQILSVVKGSDTYDDN